MTETFSDTQEKLVARWNQWIATIKQLPNKDRAICFLAGLAIGAFAVLLVNPGHDVTVLIDAPPEPATAPAPSKPTDKGPVAPGKFRFRPRKEGAKATPDAPLESSSSIPLTQQVRALLATVRVVDTFSQGSGVIIRWDQQGGDLWVLTAYHVVDSESHITINPWPYREEDRLSAKLVAKAPQHDLALLRVSTTRRPPACLRICPPCLAPQRPRVLWFPLPRTHADEPPTVFSVGFAGGKIPPTCVTQRLQYLDSTGGHEGRFWWTDRPGWPGRSGGPLIYKSQVIGTCYGRSGGDRHGLYAAELHRLCVEAGLELCASPAATSRVRIRATDLSLVTHHRRRSEERSVPQWR